MEELQTLTFDTPVSSMEYVADGEIVVITYGKTIAFYNALRCNALLVMDCMCTCARATCVHMCIKMSMEYICSKMYATFVY